MTQLSEQERHSVEHARYQADRATPDNPECCFDYELVKTLVGIVDRLRQPQSPSNPIREALEVAQRALASCRHLQTKYIPRHDWLPHIDEDIAKVKAALSDTRPTHNCGSDDAN